jgi:hypothetical protein
MYLGVEPVCNNFKLNMSKEKRCTATNILLNFLNSSSNMAYQTLKQQMVMFP